MTASPAPSDLPPQFGRYRIVRELGRGAMGRVFLAHDAQLDRNVALKVPQLFGSDPQVLERFYREARAAARLNHPNICPVHDVGEVNGIPFLTMAHVEGRPLAEYIRADRQLPERQVAALVRALALALQEAHAQGLVHRDLKPANIMINQRKKPVIMDFGLARRVDRTTGAEAGITPVGSVIGTPGYMAPEQARGEREAQGPACDIYSLGAILYELLTGRLPFEGPPLSILGQVLTQDPPSPRRHRPDLDPRLEAICLRALARQPEDRFPSMAALAAALTEYLLSTAASRPAANTPTAVLGDDPLVAPPLDDPGSVASAPRRRGRRVLVLAVGVVALAAVVGLGPRWYYGGWGSTPGQTAGSPASEGGMSPSVAAEPRPDPNQFHLTVITKTGMQKAASTKDLRAYVFPNKQEMLRQRLGSPGVPVFRRGTTDTFELQFDYPLDQVKGFTLKVEGKNAWVCESVEFIIKQGEREVGRWSFPKTQRFSSDPLDNKKLGAVPSAFFPLKR